MEFKDLIRTRRSELHLTLEDIGNAVGVSKATVLRWENGEIKNLRRDKIAKLAKVLKVSPAYLMGWEEAETNEGIDIGLVAHKLMKNENIGSDEALKKAEQIIDYFQTHANIPGAMPIDSEVVSFNVVGRVAAGYNNVAIEEYTGDTIEIPLSMLRGYRPDECFALSVKGDSMYPKLLDGDVVIVYRCPSVDSGSIAVLLYNGDEATIKKVKYVYGEDWLELIPINPEYQVKRIEGPDLQYCQVLGKVIKLVRDM